MSKIGVETPERDDLGHWRHSEVVKYHDAHPSDWDVQEVYEAWLLSVGIKHVEAVYMLEDDTAPADVQEAYASGVSASCAGWEPKQPVPGINGVLFAIFDTEDGPVASFGYYLPKEDVTGVAL